MEQIRLLEIEIAKHRKLLNRAVGNKIIPHINYHHYEIIRLLGELDNVDKKVMMAHIATIEGVLGVTFNEAMQQAYRKAEDHYILTGEMPNEKSPET